MLKAKTVSSATVPSWAGKVYLRQVKHEKQERERERDTFNLSRLARLFEKPANCVILMMTHDNVH